MDSPGFPSLVQNFSALTGEDFAELKKLSDLYPYSQLLHLLMARAARDLKHPDQESILNRSAVYSTDRQVLKWVMTAPRTLVDQPQKQEVVLTEIAVATPTAKPEPVKVKQEPVVVLAEKILVEEKPLKTAEVNLEALHIDNPLSGDALRDDLYAELEKLQKLKHDFEISFDEFQSAHPNGSGDHNAHKSKAEKEPAAEPLIEEIKASHKKIKSDNPKQKEQNEIIEQFIKTKPSMPKAKAQGAPDDLSEDSGIFSDNVVSETLVDILLKQGKKDKAVEVLKKLIWKFPQKKAYFAAQIDKLKN
jgi:hypothetical protein